MRQFVILLALAALAFFGWNYYKKHQDEINPHIPWLAKSSDAAGGEDNPAGPLTPVEGPRGAAQPPPREPFVSKIQVPVVPDGQKPMAPPGYVYITERVSAQTAHGVIAVVPGDLVKILQRKSNGTVKVTNDQVDFEVKESQTTRDTQTAIEAEMRYQKSRTLLR